MAQNNSLNNRSSTFTVDNLLTVTAGGATISGNSTINGGTVGIGTDNAANAITIGTGNVARTIDIGFSAASHGIRIGVAFGAAQVSIESGTAGATVNSVGGAVGLTGSTGASVGSAGGSVLVDGQAGVEINSTAGTLQMGNDADAFGINIGTGAAARTITVGNVTGTTGITLNSGTAGVAINTTGAGDFVVTSADTVLIDSAGVLELNSSAGVISIGNDAVSQNINIGTAGTRLVTVGTTTSSSSLALKYGTADFSLASATGNVMVALDTGEITYPLQPAFLATKSASTTNVTGNGTLYTYICDTEKYDVNGDYNNGTGTFTAPVTGKYFLSTKITVVGCTIAISLQQQIATSNNTFSFNSNRTASASNYDWAATTSCDMDAADTAQFKVRTAGEAGDTDDVYGDGSTDGTACNGWLLG